MIIDSHHHFWQYSPQKHPWIGESMAALKKDFLPEDLQKIFDENKVVGSVAVQAEQSEEETHFLLKLSDQYDWIKGVVGWVDLCDECLPERLEEYAQYDKLKGFRHIVQDEPDPDFLLAPAFQRGLSYLEQHGFTYDLLVYPHQLPAAYQTVKNFPNLKFVIDHIAKPDIRNSHIKEWGKAMEKFTPEKNVYCKVSGMVTEASWKGWQKKDFYPYLDVILEVFGTGRIMFGSDWPVCLLAGSYQEILDIIRHYVQDFPESDKKRIFYQNAVDFYRLEMPRQQ